MNMNNEKSAEEILAKHVESNLYRVLQCHDKIIAAMHEYASQSKGGGEEVKAVLQEAANEYADKHGFRVPFDGSNKFYDDDDVRCSKEGFIAGAEWQASQPKEDVGGEVFRWVKASERLPEVFKVVATKVLPEDYGPRQDWELHWSFVDKEGKWNSVGNPISIEWLEPIPTITK